MLSNIRRRRKHNLQKKLKYSTLNCNSILVKHNFSYFLSLSLFFLFSWLQFLNKHNEKKNKKIPNLKEQLNDDSPLSAASSSGTRAAPMPHFQALLTSLQVSVSIP